VRCFKRGHNTGTEIVLTQHADVWRIQISLSEPNHNPMTITGYVAQSLALAKELADKEISKYGHVCTEACKDWIQIQ
jgi:hypothetical protein